MKSKHLLLIYFLLLHVAMGICLVKSDYIQKAKEKFGLPKPELTKHYHIMVASHRQMDASIPDGSVIFIGDSITQNLAVSAISDQSVNLGISSDTTVGVLIRLQYYHSLARAKMVVLAIGTNDLIRRKNSEIIENYRSILQMLGNDIQIMISAILPVDEKIKKQEGKNKRILELNQQLKKLGQQLSNVIYVDAGKLLIDDAGNLDTKYHLGDGLHLNASGYRILINLLKARLIQPSQPIQKVNPGEASPNTLQTASL